MWCGVRFREGAGSSSTVSQVTGGFGGCGVLWLGKVPEGWSGAGHDRFNQGCGDSGGSGWSILGGCAGKAALR